ncbi:hypothetical protein XH94_26980 [Bradyrhizobium zhanjiangense]|uniref:Uncharacterized protein n=1 Tax=Bradyrhizobium zhanjiangense TaxID=1325107 RepID=A0A4V1L2W4_9BRAD|nr:hypothetical protein XH94_26980 [Bradyrhizobium zhanjiangense]
MLLKLLVGRDRVRSVHQRRAAAHIDRHAERLLDLLTRRAEPDERFGVKANAAVAMRSDAKRQRDQLLRLLVERAVVRGA